MIAEPCYNKDMQFAHMIGEHRYNSFDDKLAHLTSSWAGFVASIIIGAIICFIVYKHIKVSKEDSKKQ